MATDTEHAPDAAHADDHADDHAEHWTDLQYVKLAILLAGRRNKIEIVGHAAAKYLPADSPWRNLDHLAFQRSENVKDILVAEGLDDVVGLVYLKDVARRSFDHRDAESIERVESLGLRAHLSRGTYRTVIGVIGDESEIAAS